MRQVRETITRLHVAVDLGYILAISSELKSLMPEVERRLGYMLKKGWKPSIARLLISINSSRFGGGGNGKIYGKGMSAARQISRRFGRATGALMRSALSDCVVRTVLFVPDPRKVCA